jgi:hypothetical protein
MDDPKIRLYPDEFGGWNWELLLEGKSIAHGSPGTQEVAFAAARRALAKERERRSNG